MHGKHIPPSVKASLTRAEAAFMEWMHQIDSTPAHEVASPPRTVAEFLTELSESDISIAEWARVNKQPVNVVYMICYGRTLGTRGRGREVARAMNIALPKFQFKRGVA